MLQCLQPQPNSGKLSTTMFFDSKQLLDGRWGIFVNNRLIATIGSSQACQELISYMKIRLAEQSPELPGEVLDSAFEYLRSIKLIL